MIHALERKQKVKQRKAGPACWSGAGTIALVSKAVSVGFAADIAHY